MRTISPAVSVVIPAFNAAPFVARAVESVLAQTLDDIEVIVVDDGSTDSTRAVVRELARRSARVTLLGSEENRGPGHARNRGIEATRGGWIAILDADDHYHPERLEHLVAVGERTGADVVADDLIFWRAGERIPTELPFPPGMPPEGSWIGLAAFLRNAVPYGSPDLVWLQPMVRWAFIEDKKISYCEDLLAGEDFLYYVELLAAGARYYVSRRAYYICEQRGDSLSRGTDRRCHYSDLIESHRRARALLADRADRSTLRLLDWRGRVIDASLRLAEMRHHLRTGQRRAAVAALLKIAVNPAAYVKYHRVWRNPVRRRNARLREVDRLGHSRL